MQCPHGLPQNREVTNIDFLESVSCFCGSNTALRFGFEAHFADSGGKFPFDQSHLSTLMMR